MRRTTARGRVFPQFYSTDRRYARLSIKAIAIFPLMWSNADDQGRLGGDPEEIKYTCCPNIDDISKSDVPQLLAELAQHEILLLYNTHRTAAIQMLDWWKVHQKLQWAWPSDYPPPNGWQDHLRYKKDAKTVITLSWPVSGETLNGSQVSTENGSGETQADPDHPASVLSGTENSQHAGASLPLPLSDKEEEEERGRGKSPESLKGSQVSTPPSLTGLCTDGNKISSQLVDNFRHWFGHVKASDPNTNIPREPAAKDLAQLRDLAEELVRGGGVPLDFIRQAFREAGGQTEESKHSVSYVRIILLAWLGRPKDRSP